MAWRGSVDRERKEETLPANTDHVKELVTLHVFFMWVGLFVFGCEVCEINFVF